MEIWQAEIRNIAYQETVARHGGQTGKLLIIVVICKKSKVLIKHDHGIDWSCENYFTRTPTLNNTQFCWDMFTYPSGCHALRKNHYVVMRDMDG